MTTEIIRLASVREARKRKRKSDRQRYAEALRRQKPIEDWEHELNAMIGPPGGDFPPDNAA